MTDINPSQARDYTITLDTPLKDLLYMARDLGHSKSLASFDFGEGRVVTFMCFAVDAEGYGRAVQAYEDGRDEYARKVADAVIHDIKTNGIPKEGERLNLELGAHSDNAEDYESNDSTESK